MEIIEYKKGLIERLLQLSITRKSAAKKHSDDTRIRASQEEGAMQSRYSTFKEEGQYLADGLKLIHMDLETEVSIIQSLMNEPIKENIKVESLAIVDVEFEDESTEKFFIFPAMGGNKIDDLIVITPSSPLGKSLLLKKSGDEFKFNIAGKIKKGEITDVK